MVLDINIKKFVLKFAIEHLRFFDFKRSFLCFLSKVVRREAISEKLPMVKFNRRLTIALQCRPN